MECAIIDKNNHLYAIINIGLNEYLDISNNKDYDFIIRESFNLDDRYEYADYIWNGSSFELINK